jgi:hypothetical protein
MVSDCGDRGYLPFENALESINISASPLEVQELFFSS